MNKNKLNVFFAMVCFTLTSFLLASKSAGQVAEDNYYYSRGQKISIILDTNRVAVVFQKNASLDSVRSVLPRFRQFDTVESIEKQNFARANIYLVPLTQSLTALNFRMLNIDLQSSNLFKSIGKVFTLQSKPESDLILTEEFVVKFKPDITREQIDQFNVNKRVEIVSSSEYVKNQFILRVRSDSEVDALTIANQYYESDFTEFAHPNFITAFERRAVPNDQYYAEQWHLNNIGQGGGKVDADIDAPEAWNITTGNPNIRIAILDDSIEKNHEDLQTNIVVSRDFTDDDDDPSPGPGDYHGTSVAGIVAAIGNNNKGVAGVGYSSKIVAVRLGNTIQDFADVFYWAAYTANADVISNSWGLVIPAPDLVVNAVNDVATNGRGGKGCVVLFASGNSNSNISNPASGELAALNSVIAVGASTNKDVRACFSSWGEDLDVMAPSNTWIGGVCTSPKPSDAVGTWSTDQSGTGGFNDGSPPRPDAAGLYTQDFGGTSSACPTAAGVAALLLSVNSSLTRQEVQEILKATAEKIAPGDASYDATGFSDRYGYGRINAHLAVVPTVKISVSPKKVKRNKPFKIKVSASAPFNLKSVWWFGEGTGIPDIDRAHWHNVSGANPVYTYEWTASIGSKGTYTLGANARDVLYPTSSDGYPHQASEGSGIAYTTIKVTPSFGFSSLFITFVLIAGCFRYQTTKC